MANMNYIRKKYIEGGAANRKQMWIDIFTDPLINWSIYDEWGDNDVVFTTSGETGIEIPGYVHVHVNDSNISRFTAYLYWDSATHTGTLDAYINYNADHLYTHDNTELVILGNQDRIMIKNIYRTDQYGTMFMGYIPQRNMIDAFRSELTADVYQGYNVSLPVTDSSGFRLGQLYQIVGKNGEGADWGLQVDSKPDATHIVVNELPRDYTAGALIGVFPNTFGINTSEWDDKDRVEILSPRTLIGITKPVGGRYVYISGPSNISYSSPAKHINRSIFLPLFWNEATGPDSSNTIIAYEDEFKYSHAPDSNWKIKGIVPDNHLETITGTVTSFTSNSLSDTSLDLVSDELVGLLIAITSGTGYRQVRKIISNTNNTITIENSWVQDLDTDSEYFVAEFFYEHHGEDWAIYWPISDVVIRDATIT